MNEQGNGETERETNKERGREGDCMCLLVREGRECLCVLKEAEHELKERASVCVCEEERKSACVCWLSEARECYCLMFCL